MEVELASYRGLIRKTASMYVNSCEEEFEDIVQLLTMKAWVALVRFDPSRWTRADERCKAQDGFVFACVKNGMKDILKRKHRNALFIEDVSPSELGPVMSEDAELVYSSVEDEGVVLPSTLSQQDRQIVLLLYTGLTQIEAGARLGLSRHAMERVMREIRMKMADWKPTSPELAEPELPAALAA